MKDLNFEKPTEIQNRIIPRILERTNLIGQSQTGTGKSHAFLLPLMQLIDSEIKYHKENLKLHQQENLHNNYTMQRTI